MRPCFGYIRVSTVKQRDGASLDAQKDAITVFASQNDLEIVEWIEEIETASKEGRPLFGDMIKRLRKGAAEGLVIHRIDRSARNFSDWARLDEISRLGIKVYVAADALNFDTRGGRLLADIQMALAADYSRNLSIEAKKGLYGRLKQGIYPFRAPIGYKDEGGGQLKSLDPKKAPLVKVLFKLYLTGDYSITSLTAEMQRRGLKGAEGQPVVRRNVETILKIPFYCGQMRVMGKLYDGKHEPLISVSDWRAVQAIKANRCVKKSTKHGHLFRGLVSCGHCNRILTGEKQKGRVYYRCHTKSCSAGSIREDRLNAVLKRELDRLEINTADRDRLKSEIAQWLGQGGHEEMLKSLRMRLSDVNSKQDRLTDLLVDGVIDQAAFNLRKDNHTFEAKQLHEEIATIEKGQLAAEDLVEIIEYVSSLSKTYSQASPANKRQLLKNSFEKISVRSGKLVISPASWLIQLDSVSLGNASRDTIQTAIANVPQNIAIN